MEKSMSLNEVKKIVLLGAESTGKTTLAKDLAKYYNTIWLPEYGREYMEKLNREYTYDDVIKIARTHMELEKQYVHKAKGLLFIDTDLINIKVWLLHLYKSFPEWIEEGIKKANYYLYLICDLDLPWKFDPVRENPHLREYLSDYYIKEVKNYGFPYRLVQGKNEKRLENAIKAIDGFLKLERKNIKGVL